MEEIKIDRPLLDNDQFRITSIGELYWFAQYVNQGGDNLKANAKLMNNIVVNTEVLVGGELNSNETFREWTPIGSGYNNSFQGTFDGNGKTISGLYFENLNQDYVGLFGYNKGTIKNVGVVDSYFNGDCFVGGVSGYNDGTITNCYNTREVSGSKYIGGVCGYTYSSTVTNCYYLSDSDNGHDAKTKEQFNNGCVAYLLSQGDNGDVWGQDLSNRNSYPEFNKPKVQIINNPDLKEILDLVSEYTESIDYNGARLALASLFKLTVY